MNLLMHIHRLFLHTDRVTEELRVYLNASCVGSLCVQLRSYDAVRDDLKAYVAEPGVKVWIGTEYTNYALYEIITPEVIRYSISSCLLLFGVYVDTVASLASHWRDVSEAFKAALMNILNTHSTSLK